MSSGYSSLEEDSEEYYFTARTSFFNKPSGKVTENKVNTPRRQLLQFNNRALRVTVLQTGIFVAADNSTVTMGVAHNFI